MTRHLMRLRANKAKKNIPLRSDESHLVMMRLTWGKTAGSPRGRSTGSGCRTSVVDPVAAAVLPALKLALTKPQRDLFLGADHRVAAVNHIPATHGQHKHNQDTETQTSCT